MMAEKPEHPGDEPGPCCTEAERHRYAQANGKWSAWINEHPEDARETPASEEQSKAAPSPTAPTLAQMTQSRAEGPAVEHRDPEGPAT